MGSDKWIGKEAQQVRSIDTAEVFEKMPIRRAVLQQIGPSIAGQMVALAYNLADTFFVGQLRDSVQVASITVVTPLFLMLTALSNLFGVGGNSLIARLLGKNRSEKVGEVSSFCFWSSLLTAAFYALLVFALQVPLLRLCGADESTLAWAVRYSRWVLVVGSVPTILNGTLSNLVRSTGEAGVAFRGVTAGGLLNIALDPLFILPWGLGLGAEGAAIATVLSNVVSTLYLLLWLLRKKGVLRLHFRLWRQGCSWMRQVLSVGFPSALQYALTVVSITAVTRFIAPYGPEAVAALGVVKKIDMLPLYVSIGTAQGVLPLMAYNYAAGNQLRRRQTLRFAGMIACGFAVVCVVCFEIFAPTLVQIFIDDTVTVAYGVAFLRRMCIAMPLMAVGYLMIVQFQAIARPKEAMLLSVLRKGALDIPLLFLMTALIPLYGAVWVQPIVDTVAMLAALFLNHRMNRREGC